MIGNSIERPSGGAAFCGIAVMAKASAAGSTKTRLVPPLTYSEAAAFNTAFLKDVAQNILTAGRRASIAGYMAYGPPSGATFLRENIPPELGLFEASSPNFGDCLYSAICELLKRSHCSAIVLNSDSPTLPTALLLEAVEVLARPGDQAVLGPATDGGYYLLGLKKPHRRASSKTLLGAPAELRSKHSNERESSGSNCICLRRGTMLMMLKVWGASTWKLHPDSPPIPLCSLTRRDIPPSCSDRSLGQTVARTG
jgi:glycosyltransferase A (GT-A) superfamily protein (DUF2064 family)